MHTIRGSRRRANRLIRYAIPSMKSKPIRVILHAVVAVSAGSAVAGTITCVPAPGGAGTAPWIRKISIDEHSRTVNMDIVRRRTEDTDTMGKMRADLLSMEETQGGEPAYVFNAIPAAGDEVTNLFKLFKAGEWRLIRAGVVFIGKMPALRAVDPGMVLDCKRSDLG